MSKDYRVKDLSLASFGELEILLAEKEMPALMALRKKYQTVKPLDGAKIAGCIHMTIQTAVLIETLIELGAEVRWSSCNIYSTQDHAAAALAKKGIPIFAWKGLTDEEYEWCIEQTLKKNGKLWKPNLLLDDGGDLTMKVHTDFSQMLDHIHGVSEETTTGVKRLHQLKDANKLKIPAINVNDSITKSKNDNRYGCRHSLNDAIKRATDSLLSGKKALVFGYGDVGKGSAESLKQEKMIVDIVETDPICAMQACFDGFQVVCPFLDGLYSNSDKNIDKNLLSDYDLIVTATGNVDVLNRAMLKHLKDYVIVCNIGHFDNEIDVKFLSEFNWQNIKNEVDLININDKKIILLSKGRLVNLGNSTGHPSRVMDGSFANQVMAQIYLFQQKFAESKDKKLITIKTLPRKLDEEIAKMMVEGFGGKITKMSKTQYEYLGIEENSQLKGDNYKY